MLVFFCQSIHVESNYCVVLGCHCDTPVRCLTHSFSVHTHYEVAPPYPQFVPHVSMACPGVAVFNTGDSLIALDIRIDTEQSSHLTSVRFASDLCPSSHVDSDADDAVVNSDTLVASESSALPITPTLSASAPTVYSDDEQMTANNPPVDPGALPKGNLSKFPVTVENPAISNQRHLRVCNSETILQHENESDIDTASQRCNTDGDVCAAHSTVLNSTKQMSNSSQTASDSVDLTGFTQYSDKNEERSSVSDCPIVSPQLHDSGSGRPNVGQYHSLSHAASSSCSPAGVVSSPVIVQNDTQCFTYSVRRYSSAVMHSADIEGIHSDRQHTLYRCY